MKRKLLTILGILAFSALGASAATSVFNSNQIATSTPTSGFVIQSNGANAPASWVATSSLGISGGGGVSTSSDQSLTISGTNGIINVGHANSWTGLETFNRAGNAAILIGNSPQAVFNASSGLYGQLLFQSAGSNKGAVAWDSNGGMYYLASPFFTHRFRVGSDEMMAISNSGVVINGLGSGNSYTLDVKGTFGVSSIGAGSVPYVDSGGGFIGNTNNLVYSGTNFFGVNKSSPAASIHAGVLTRTVADVTGLNATVSPISSGIPLGFSNEGYSVWAERLVGATNIFSSNAATLSVSEPNINDYYPNSMSVQETSGGGYDMSVDTPPSYATYDLYDGNGCYANGFASASIGSWSSGSGTTDVAVTINGPNLGTPSSYYIVRNGSDGQSVSGSFTDSNNNWSGGATPPVGICQWAISLSWSSVTDASDYVAANTSNTSYINTSGVTSIQDVGSWGGGSPTVTPTSLDDDSFISDGTTYLMKLGGKFSAFGVTPVSQQTSSDEICVGLQNLGFWANEGSGACSINVNSLTANSGTFNTGTFNSTLTANSTAVFNGQATFNSNLIAAGLFQASGVIQFPLVSNITTGGTSNNVNTAGLATIHFTGTSAQTVTGFSSTGNGKILFVSNRATTTALTLKNENTGSATTSRIITPTGGDFLIAPSSGMTMQYDNTSSRWRVLSMSLPISSDFNKIGIGTTTPIAALSVKGTAGINPFVIASSSDAQVFVVDSFSNVGVGTSTPASRLTVSGLAGLGDVFSTASSTGAPTFKIMSSGFMQNGGTSPTIATSTGAGTATAVSDSGTNNGGVISITTGATPSTSAVVATVTYTQSCANDSAVQLFPGNASTALLSGTSMVYTDGTASAFTINAGSVALTGLTTYIWNYQVTCY